MNTRAFAASIKEASIIPATHLPHVFERFKQLLTEGDDGIAVQRITRIMGPQTKTRFTSRRSASMMASSCGGMVFGVLASTRFPTFDWAFVGVTNFISESSSAREGARIVVSIAALASMAAAGCAKPSHDAGSPTAITEEQRVLEVEDAYVAAEVNRDEAALRRLVDDRFMHNSADGTSSNKENLIHAVLNMNMIGQTISERSVIVEGDMAVVFGTAELRFQDPDKPERVSRLRYTSVYVKRHEEWRLLALQMQPRSTRARVDAVQ